MYASPRPKALWHSCFIDQSLELASCFTHGNLNKLDNTFQTILWNTFSLMNIVVFRFKLQLNLFSVVQQPLCLPYLIHLPLDKMSAILAEDNFKCIFLNRNYKIPFPISLKFVPRSPTDNKPALVQVMAWCQTGDKPLSEQMLTQFKDACMWH